MTTIILVSLGILLAAVSALMVVFYGGDAFEAGSMNARASELMNAGMNVLAANDLQRAETGVIGSSIPDLVATKHLDVRPQLAGATSVDAWRLAATGTGDDATLYVATGLDADLCRNMLKRQGSDLVPHPYVTGRMGCYSPTQGSYAFYTVLERAAGRPQGIIAGSFE